MMTKDIQSKIFIYFLPVYYIYNMLIDVVFVRGSTMGVIMNVVILVTFIYFLFYNSYNKKYIYVYIWILLNIVLILLNSSNIVFSFKEFAKSVIGLLSFPLSFYYISTNNQIVRFIKVLVCIMLLYIVNLILANTFDWGQSYGANDSEYAVQGGASIVTGSMPIVIALMIAPFILTVIPQKKLFIAIWCITIICVMLIFKRTNIAALFVGYFVLFIIYQISKPKIVERKYKIIGEKFKKYILALAVLLSVLAIIFGQVIIAQFEQRSKKYGKDAFEKEGRVVEWYLVKKVILNSDERKTFLFGKEPYNTQNNYGFKSERNIHGDYSMVLFSTGIIGSVLYWSMQIYIALLVIKYWKKRYLRSNYDVLLFATYLSTSLIWFLFSFSATLRYVLISAVYYMIHGMILRYFWNKHIRQEKMIILNKHRNENPNSSQL